VYIVGAGNSGCQSALHLAKHARSVTLLVRGESFASSMSAYLVRAIESTPNVHLRHRTEVIDGAGDGSLERLTLADRRTGTLEEVGAAGLFIMIGGDPRTRWLPDEVARDPQGYVMTGRDVSERTGILETSMPGVFAAGDVRHGATKRVASAVGDGATVVRLVHDYLSEADARLAPDYAAEA
jgi:thioredoxin reductase (NADPH)